MGKLLQDYFAVGGRKQLPGSSQKAPEVNGDAEGSQSGQVDTFGFGAANLCSLPCQPGIRSWPSGWNSEKDYVWGRKVWKRLGLGVFLFFSFFGYNFKY